MSETAPVTREEFETLQRTVDATHNVRKQYHNHFMAIEANLGRLVRALGAERRAFALANEAEAKVRDAGGDDDAQEKAGFRAYIQNCALSEEKRHEADEPVRQAAHLAGFEKAVNKAVAGD